MDGSDDILAMERANALMRMDPGMSRRAAILAVAGETELQRIELRMVRMSPDDPLERDAERRREVHARHAQRYPASLTTGTLVTTFRAIHPRDGVDVPCQVELRTHGIAGWQALAPAIPTSGHGATCEGDAPLCSLNRPSTVRLFGLAGEARGELVDDLGAALASAWVAEGLGRHMDEADLLVTARALESDRMARSGLGALRELLPARFREALAFLALPDGFRDMPYLDAAINALVREPALCGFVAGLGGLAPLCLARTGAMDPSSYPAPADFVRRFLKETHVDAGWGVTDEEAEWLLRTFAGSHAILVDEALASGLVSYRRALGFRELAGSDLGALAEILSLADHSGTRGARTAMLGLIGRLGPIDGMPAAFLSGVERHREATGLTEAALAACLCVDARDMADAVWNAVGSHLATVVAGLREPGIIPMLVWQLTDPAVPVFMDGLRRLAREATCHGEGAEGLLAATEHWIGSRSPGHEAGKLGGLGRRGAFREIAFAKDAARGDNATMLRFIRDGLGLDLEPGVDALAREVYATAVETQERWLRGEPDAPVTIVSPEPVVAKAPIDGIPKFEEPAMGQGVDTEVARSLVAQTAPPPAAVDGEPPEGAGPWWKRTGALRQALARRRAA